MKRLATRCRRLVSQQTQNVRPLTTIHSRRPCSLFNQKLRNQRSFPSLNCSKYHFSTIETDDSVEDSTPMLCMQCEQTSHGTGCTAQGICGKQVEASNSQDLLQWANCGLAQYVTQLGPNLIPKDLISDIRSVWLEGNMATLTNVNFDEERVYEYLEKNYELRTELRKAYRTIQPDLQSFEYQNSAATWEYNSDIDYINDSAIKYASLRQLPKKFLNDDCWSLREFAHYGLKGLLSYWYHVNEMHKFDDTVISSDVHDEIFTQLFRYSSELLSFDYNMDQWWSLCRDLGKSSLTVLQQLDGAHVQLFGNPEISTVQAAPVPGKCILVSGHDILDCYRILKATEGKDINVYTHGELLPANTYPELKKFPHFIGHYGRAWQRQIWDFRDFPGAIVMTTNCMMPPRRKYKDRLFTLNGMGYEGIPHIDITTDAGISAIMEAANKATGFNEKTMKKWKDEKPYVCGFGRTTILSSHIDTLVSAVESGSLRDIFIIGGCDGTEKQRNYFTDLGSITPDDSLILTLGCGKYRLRDLNLGNFGGTDIPRIIDVGQCNDVYTAIVVATTLADRLNTNIESLPIHYALSWFEQKSMCVLLTLFELGVRKIKTGPALPAFLNNNVRQFLSDKFEFSKVNIDDQSKDLSVFLSENSNDTNNRVSI